MKVNGLLALLLLLIVYPANLFLFDGLSAHTIFTSSLPSWQYSKIEAISVTEFIKKYASLLLLPLFPDNHPSYKRLYNWLPLHRDDWFGLT